MKYVLILGDGMADNPVPELSGMTPLMKARKPSIDHIARYGRTGRFITIEPDMPTGSAVANLSVLGYDPRKVFHGRGVLEAASLGIDLSQTDMAMRANLICVKNGKIKSHSAGHITDDEAQLLIDDLSKCFSRMGVSLYQGLSYRHLLVIPDGNPALECAPPHDHLDEQTDGLMVRPLTEDAADTARLINKLIQESAVILKSHPVNKKRKADGKDTADLIWPWSPGTRPDMPTFNERFGLKGAAISAVDLIKGLAVYSGFDVIPVDGATGLYDTNYEGKASACLDALRDHDLVFVHVEAADEASHERNLELKIRCIEDLDRRLVQPVLNGLKDLSSETVVAVLPDHATPVACGAHTRDPVPFAIMDPRENPDTVDRFDEKSVMDGSLGILKGSEFIETFIGRNSSRPG
ncbi:MAG: cofactor-independent phosphoglycerate mutase [Elusimicrobiota bacterium]